MTTELNTYEVTTKEKIADLFLGDLYNCEIKALNESQAKNLFINEMKRQFNIIIYASELFVKWIIVKR